MQTSLSNSDLSVFVEFIVRAKARLCFQLHPCQINIFFALYSKSVLTYTTRETVAKRKNVQYENWFQEICI